MKKLGRRMRDRAVKVCKVSRQLAAVSDEPVRDIVERHLLMQAGDVVLLENWRTGATERWVLVRPLEDPVTRSGEDWDDFISNTLTYQRRQVWEAAFSGRDLRR